MMKCRRQTNGWLAFFLLVIVVMILPFKTKIRWLNLQVSQIRRSRCGWRFRDYFNRELKRNGVMSPFRVCTRVAVALLFLVLAILGGLLPVMPGFAFLLIALVIIAPLWCPLATFLDRCELRMLHVWRRLRGH